MLKSITTKKAILRIVLTGLIIALILSFFLVFTYQLKGLLRKQTEITLQESNQRSIHALEKRFSDTFSTLNALTIFVREYDNIGKDRILNVLHEQTGSNGFSSMAVIAPDGTSHTTDGEVFNSSDREYFQKAMAGERNLSFITDSRTDGTRTIIFAEPIYQNNRIIGVLTGSYSPNVLSELLDVKIFDGMGYAFLIDQSGNPITHLDSKKEGFNYLDLLKNCEFESRYSLEQFTDDMAQGKSGLMRYFNQENSQIVNYVPTEFDDWYLLTCVPSNYISSQLKDISQYAFLLLLMELTVLAAVGIYIIFLQRRNTDELSDTNQKFEALTSNIPGGVFRYCGEEDGRLDFISDGLLQLFDCTESRFRERFDNQFINMVYEPDRKRVLQEINTQLADKDKYKLEFRIVTEGGRICWLFCRGQQICDASSKLWIYVVVMNITASKRATEALRLSEERYRIISEQSHSVIFEHNLGTGEIFYNANYEKKFGYPPVTSSFPSSFLQNSIVHAEEQAAFTEFFSAMMNGTKSYDEMECRILKSDGDYLWCEFQVSLIRDDEGYPLKLVGRITDIDASKREHDRLKEESQRDPLTKLYNIASTRALINNYLSHDGRDGCHALLFIDIDNFKSVNDNLGHLFGNVVLRQISHTLLQLFRSTDVIGRVGGDEFVVFLKDAQSKELINEKACELCTALRQIYTGIDENYCVTGSVGIALYPSDGKTYDELIKKSDLALYYSKDLGKNQYSFYSEGVSNIKTGSFK